MRRARRRGSADDEQLQVEAEAIGDAVGVGAGEVAVPGPVADAVESQGVEPEAYPSSDDAVDATAPDDVADRSAIASRPNADHDGDGDGAGDGSAADAALAGPTAATTAAPPGVEGAALVDVPPDTAGEAPTDAGPATEAGQDAADADLAALVAHQPAAEPEPPDPMAEGRPAPLRIAGLHVRTGQYALARAELEALAGRGRLDEAALLDLAEVRWRTGDLAGAGDAANALLARGSEPPLALVIAAEAVAAVGRPGEARRLSSRALEAVNGPLDPLFAGMPRALIWPPAEAASPAKASPRRRGRRAVGEGVGAPSTASEAFAGGRAALARGDASRAALLLGVAMRLEPGFAEDVLRAVAGRDDQPLLALVRGDALRLLGREADALEAFDRARGRASMSATAAAVDRAPGLFDADPAISDDSDD